LKAKVALDAVRGKKTLAEVAKQHLHARGTALGKQVGMAQLGAVATSPR
jgi:hypothetical protein